MASIDLKEVDARVHAGLIAQDIREDCGGDSLIISCYTHKAQFGRNWDEYTMICRGIVTNWNGDIISRPFRKFFNLGEVDPNSLDWSDSLEVTEKIDGSLIIVSFLDGQMILNSKCAFGSPHAQFAREWLVERCAKWVDTEKRYSIHIPRESRMTFCFEAIFPEGRVVMDYGDQRKLVLLSVIDVETGEECNYNDLKLWARIVGVEPVQSHTFENIHDLIASTRARSIKEGEGIVIRFMGSNTRVKVKSEEYVKIHRLISHISPKHVWDVLSSGEEYAEFYKDLPDELYDEVRELSQKMVDTYWDTRNVASHAVDYLVTLNSRKEQAQYVLKNYPDIKSVIFGMLDGDDVTPLVWNVVRKKWVENG
jgi:RNA ligase